MFQPNLDMYTFRGFRPGNNARSQCTSFFPNIPLRNHHQSSINFSSPTKTTFKPENCRSSWKEKLSNGKNKENPRKKLRVSKNWEISRENRFQMRADSQDTSSTARIPIAKAIGEYMKERYRNMWKNGIAFE